jgi:precorrin-3B C17-methyltransferase
MRQERARADQAINLALDGTATAVVSSGDAGIYGMAGLILETLERRGLAHALPMEVIPGIPALAAAAARLGAPLMHDFAVISLSDLLTPAEHIRQRLHAAAQGDFVTVLYNPASTRRQTLLPEALVLLAAHRPPTTPVGFVRNAFRPDEAIWTCLLPEATAQGVDMRTIVIVGNSTTRLVGGHILTPRGYYARESGLSAKTEDF